MNAVRRIALGLVLLGLLAPAMGFADEEEGFKPIFDGKSLEGWDGDPKFWRVEEGAIIGETTGENPTPHNTFIIWRQGEVDDFELKLEYKIVGHNSGVQYRSFEVPEEKWVVGGYQADFEAGDTYSGILYGERFRGILAPRGKKTVIQENGKPEVVGEIGDSKELQSHIKQGDWNEYHIIARGYHFIHKINGQTMSECTDEDTSDRRRSGIVAFQLHRGPAMKVQFRNIRLKRLKLEDKKKVSFLAGRPSHGYGAHEHNAGCKLLAERLAAGHPGVLTTVYTNGWPADPTALDNVDGIVMYCDGAGRHMAASHIGEIDAKLKEGVGLACFHFAVEVTKGEPGEKFLAWIGGYFEIGWSVNPHWTADFQSLPEHPITRGVEPFTINDEWYYQMRFRPGLEDVTPILTATPPDETRLRKVGGRSGNPRVRARLGEPEHVAWALEREDGGRGFGFTGGHVHWNWGHPQFRKLALNAIAWVAGAEVPSDGVPPGDVSVEDLMAHQDEPPPKNFDKAGLEKKLAEWRSSESGKASGEE